jgi:hypothetical protein
MRTPSFSPWTPCLTQTTESNHGMGLTVPKPLSAHGGICRPHPNCAHHT